VESSSRSQVVTRGGVRSGSTREDLLEAAERVFARHGFAGGSLDEVAEQVGIRRPSLLHHFRSKRELYDAVEQRIFEALNEGLPELEAADSYAERLIRLLRHWLTFMINRPTAARIVLRNSSDLISRADNPVEFSGRTVESFTTIIDEGVKSGEFRPIEPIMVLNILGFSILSFVCNADQFGTKRKYDILDNRLQAEFEDNLRRAAMAILMPKHDQGHLSPLQVGR